MAKPRKRAKVTGLIRLQIGAGQAAPSQSVGPALGQRGLNIMEFCKAFNAATESVEKGTPIPVLITAYEDRTFTFVTRKPPVSWYLCRAANVSKGSATPGRLVSGKVSRDKVQEIAREKQEDMNAISLEAAMKSVEGSARSLGLVLEEEA